MKSGEIGDENWYSNIPTLYIKYGTDVTTLLIIYSTMY